MLPQAHGVPQQKDSVLVGREQHGVPQQKDSVLVGREQPGEALASSKAEQMVGTDMYENGLCNNK